MAPFLEMHGISKSFPGVKALDRVDLALDRGEVLGLVGENGAGKSTLMKIMTGVYQADTGEIMIDGQKVAIDDPEHARELGLSIIYQELSMVENLTVAENIALSLDEKISISELSKKAAELSAAYGLPLDPGAHVADLSVGERQRIEIVRALLQNPKLIILDEPTSVLTPQEADKLFETLFKLKAEGRSVLYISHRLEEVQRICDRATVLRHGKVTGACDPRQETPASLARMMVGADVAGVEKVEPPADGAIQLQVTDLSVNPRTPFAMTLKHVSMTVKAGEILAIAGVAGNGQSELFDALSGEYPVQSPDAIRLRGKSVGRLGINERRLLGGGFVPEERQGHAAIPAMSLSENLFLSRNASDRSAYLSGGKIGLIRHSLVQQAARRISEMMDVRKSGDDPAAGSLSGGNLQKFIVGRELDRQPSVLVVNQPTWGVDAGAASRIRQALVDLAMSGSAVVVISQDLDEIFEVATSIAAISEGRLSDAYPASTMTRERIGILMGGVHGVQTAPEAAHAH